MNVSSSELLNNIEGYAGYYKLLLDIAGEFEMLARLPPDVQTKNAINLFRNKIKSENIDAVEAADKIITARFYVNWDAKNRQRYSTGKLLLTDWIDFFISYTNSSKP